jgi:hypothetical protein
MRLMQRIRDAIMNDCFPEFVKKFLRNYYFNPKNAMQIKEKDTLSQDKTEPNKFNIPRWVINAMNAVNINLLED